MNEGQFGASDHSGKGGDQSLRGLSMGHTRRGGYFGSVESIGSGFDHISYFTWGLPRNYSWYFPCHR